MQVSVTPPTPLQTGAGDKKAREAGKGIQSELGDGCCPLLGIQGNSTVFVSGGLRLTTSVPVIPASSSVSSSADIEQAPRPSTAAPMLPVAIMDGGYIAKV